MMKKYISLAFLSLLIATLTSCLKDGNVNIPEGASPAVVEFKNISPLLATTVTVPGYIQAFEASAASATFNLIVNYTGSDPAPADIPVTVELYDAAISTFNEEHETEYQKLPDGKFSVPSFTATIKAGEHTAVIPVTVKPNEFDFSISTAIGFRITAASGQTISSNYSTCMVAVLAKNPYDGRYQYTTSANTSLAPNKNTAVNLETSSATSVKIVSGGASLLATYSNPVFYTIDPATNQVTVTCASLGVETPQDTRSKWDPATKTMTVFWKQAGGGRTFEEKFVYIGVR